MNIILIGFMTSGKTTVGNLLAEKLNYAFLDTDTMIENNTAKTIPEIFAREGEEKFRSYESAVIEDIAHRTKCVVSTGGGIIIKPENRQALKKAGKVIYLKVTVEDVLARAGDYTKRPLINYADPFIRRSIVEDLLKKRENWYQETADLVLDTVSGDIDKNVTEIIQYLGGKK